MREMNELFRLPSEDVDYQPEPETVAGFIATMANKVDELLVAADWRPNWE